MNTQRKTIVAGIAALALFAGVGIAAAQDTPEQNQNKMPQARPPAAQQMNKGQAADKMNHQGATAQSEKAKMHKSAQRTHINRKSAAVKGRMRGQTAAHQRPNAQQNAQQGPNGQQSSASASATDLKVFKAMPAATCSCPKSNARRSATAS